MAVHQNFLENAINFIDEKAFFKLMKQQQKELKIKINSSFLIIDEFDNLFDGAKILNIIEKFQIMQQFGLKIIGFTSSNLSNEEIQCIFQQSFDSDIIKFPFLLENQEGKILQRRSFIYQQRDFWINNLPNIILDIVKDVPLVLTLNRDDIKQVCNKFKSLNILFTDLTKLNSKTYFADLQITIDKLFSIRNDQGLYGIFIIDDSLGRGTDFPSSKDIEDNGGIYVVLGDVFNKRSTQQIIGRTGRLLNKGQFSYVSYMKMEDYQQTTQKTNKISFDLFKAKMNRSQHNLDKNSFNIEQLRKTKMLQMRSYINLFSHKK